MKSIQDIISEQRAISGNLAEKENEKTEKTEHKIWLLKLASSFTEFLRKETLKTEVVNQKDYSSDIKSLEQAVKSIPRVVSVDNQEDYSAALDNIANILSNIKIPEVTIPETIIPDNKKELLSIEKAVKEIKFPEVKIPEQKSVDFSELISEIKRLEKSLTGGSSQELIKTQKLVSSVLKKVESGLNNIDLSLKKLDKEIVIPETDLTPLISAVNESTKATQEQVFPVPNFSSSWQHSLSMQAEDLPKLITYNGTSEDINYIEFTANDGNTYRNTYNYDNLNRLVGWTGWIKQ